MIQALDKGGRMLARTSCTIWIGRQAGQDLVFINYALTVPHCDLPQKPNAYAKAKDEEPFSGFGKIQTSKFSLL